MAAELQPASAAGFPFPAPVTMEEQDPAGPESRAGAEGERIVPCAVWTGTGRASPRWATPQWVKQERLEEPVRHWQSRIHTRPFPVSAEESDSGWWRLEPEMLMV
ncbi:hypothetical protein Y1Q_0000822 [Alligator mississippiensis]|uniref:Uncharacterized protein n=1 Tax=Alligator mississippiensis TaxID=8496 RepID=A0A151MW35_ALLMI|nr:hypothetical protein Y1Q_0000822 [Alligator mississippiensis]